MHLIAELKSPVPLHPGQNIKSVSEMLSTTSAGVDWRLSILLRISHTAVGTKGTRRTHLK